MNDERGHMLLSYPAFPAPPPILSLPSLEALPLPILPFPPLMPCPAANLHVETLNAHIFGERIIGTAYN